MITREDLKNVELDNIQSYLEAQISSFMVEIEQMDEEQLLSMEGDLMTTMDEYDAYIKGVTYELPESCVFDEETFSKKQICEYVSDYINTQEVQWEHVSGLYDLCKIWRDNKVKNISYGAYDSTLRILGLIKYKGMRDWKRIMAIYSYLSESRAEYTRDLGYIIYLSQIHNSILNRMNPQPETQEDAQ